MKLDLSRYQYMTAGDCPGCGNADARLWRPKGSIGTAICYHCVVRGAEHAGLCRTCHMPFSPTAEYRCPMGH